MDDFKRPDLRMFNISLNIEFYKVNSSIKLSDKDSLFRKRLNKEITPQCNNSLNTALEGRTVNSPKMKKVSILPLFFLGLISHAQSSENEIIKVSELREHMTYEVLAYPNPSQGNLHIEAPNGSVCTIVSTNGVYVGTWKIEEEGLDITGLPTGSYIATIRKGEKMSSKKILVL
jgi:hypothetical protein